MCCLHVLLVLKYAYFFMKFGSGLMQRFRDQSSMEYGLVSVRSWNFKDGGSLKATFLAKNQHATKEKCLKKFYE